MTPSDDSDHPCPSKQPHVLRAEDLGWTTISNFLQRLGLALDQIQNGEPIPGSFWGDEEAGLIGKRILARPDTPLHSILHEACHWLCMDEQRREQLHTNAGGDYDEENAVCYLQILLSDELAGFGRQRCMADMDSWGYSFRLGSAERWFYHDAEDALAWLIKRGIVNRDGTLSV